MIFEAELLPRPAMMPAPTKTQKFYMEEHYIKLDKINWWVYANVSGRHAQPLCPIDDLRLRPIMDLFSNKYNFMNLSRTLKCEDCGEEYKLPRSFELEQIYVIDKIDAKIFKKMRFINLDDEAIPIAEDKIKGDSEYFVTSLLMESKVGKRLVVYAGKKGSSQKTQIFVEPEIKRLAFDQKNLHPTDVFSSVEAVFEDGTKHKMEKR